MGPIVGDKLPESMLPYDVFTRDRASFVAFAGSDGFIALPLLSLSKATLRPGAQSIVLEFGSVLVRIDGRGLDDLFESILLGMVRVIRTGKHPRCSIESVRIIEIALG